MKKLYKNFLIFAFVLMMSLSTLLIRPLGTNAAEVDDTWLLKKYETVKNFQFPGVAVTDFDNKTFKSLYSELADGGSKVVFNTDSINYFTYNDSVSDKNKIYARLDDVNDYLKICNFSNIDVISILYYSGHSVSECSNNNHSFEGTKTLNLHLLDSFKTSGATELLLSYDIFPEPICIENVQLRRQNDSSNISIKKSGDVYYKDPLNQYEFYTYNTSGTGTSDSSSSSSTYSSSTSSDSSTSSEEQYQNVTISLFDGSVDTEFPASGTKTICGVTSEWKYLSLLQNPDSYKGKQYKYSLNFGLLTGSSKFFKFSVPNNVVEFSVFVVGSGYQKNDFFLNSTLMSPASATENGFCCFESKLLSSGDYQFFSYGELNNLYKNVFEISLNLKIDPNYEPIPDTPTEESTYPLRVNFNCSTNGDRPNISVIPSADENFDMNTYQLPTPELKTGEIFQGWYTDNGTFQDEFTLEDFKNLDFTKMYDLNHRDVNVYAKILTDEPTDSSEQLDSSNQPNSSKRPTTSSNKDDKDKGNGSTQVKDYDDYHIDFSQWSLDDFWNRFTALIRNPGKFFEEVGKAIAKAPFVQILHLILKIIVAVVVGFLLFKGIKALVNFFRNR